MQIFAQETLRSPTNAKHLPVQHLRFHTFQKQPDEACDCRALSTQVSDEISQL